MSFMGEIMLESCTIHRSVTMFVIMFLQINWSRG